MKILSVTIENFLTIGEAKVELADRGLVLIQGENLDDTSADSNGAGKSSLPDAVCWALYGVTARGEDGDQVVNQIAGKNCCVTVYIEDGADSYRVTRYRKHKTGKNSVQLHKLGAPQPVRTLVDLTKGTNALTDAEIVKLIGCSYEVFKSAVYAGQEQMPDLPGMTDKQLKMLVEEASGTTLLEAAYKEANARLGTAKTTMSEIQGRIEFQAQRLTDAQSRFDSLQNSSKQYESDRAASVNDLKAKAKQEADNARTVAGQLAKFDKVATQGVIKTLEEKIAAVESERVWERHLDSDVSLAKQNVAMIQAELRRLKGQADEEKRKHDDAKHQVGCPCGSCAKPITAEDVAPVQKAAAEKLRKTVASFNAAKSELETAQKSLQSVTETLEQHRASMTDVSATTASLNEMRDDLRKIENLERDKLHYIDAAKGYLKRAEEKAKEQNPFAKQIEAMERDVETIEKTLEDLKTKLDEQIEAVKVAETVSKVFSPAGVRAFILDEVTPFLNDQTAKYLGTLSDGNITATWSTLVKNAKGELKEKFSIEVANDKGGKTFKSISGGEKRKVRIAAALALQDLVARRASKPIELFIGDEIDDALDTAGLERLMQILEEKAKERGSVFVISHNNLKDWISNTITVTKKGGVSTIEEMIA